MTRTGTVLRLSTPLLAALLAGNGLGCSGSSGSRGSTGGSGGEEETGGTSGGSTGGSKGSNTGGSKGGGTGGSTGGSSGGDTGGSSGSTGGSSGSTGGSSGSTGGSSGGDGGVKDASGPGPDGPPVMAGALTNNGCKGGTCLNPECKPLTTAASPGTFASIGFEPKSPYIPKDVVIPTFDDVPDGPYNPPDKNFGVGDWTRQMVDFLDANNIHTDFFVNTANFCDVGKNATCMATLVRLIKTQNVASHTIHHIHMGGSGGLPLSPESGCRATGTITCDSELMGVEAIVNMASMGGISHLTRFRAPYGEPFQAGPPNLVAEIQGVVKKYAVHVGWAMESTDANFDDTGNAKGSAYFIKQVTDALGSGPGQGSYGVILMHGTYPWSLGELKGLMDPNTGEFKKRGFRIGTVEDAICWKYGKHSWELVGSGRTAN